MNVATGLATGVISTPARMESAFEQSLRDVGIPPRPLILERVGEEMRKEEPNFRHLGELISADVSLAAGLLKTANSSYFGFRSRARTVTQALVMLGLDVTSRAIAGLALRKVFLAARLNARQALGVIAIEPSGANFPKLATNSKLNNNRFETMKCAIGAARGTAHLSGTKHEAFSIAGDHDEGEEVPVIALDNLLDDGRVSAGGKFLIKLDVEGVEIEAIKGGARILREDSVLLAEEHGNDPQHTVSRFILEQTPMKLIVYDPRSNRMEAVNELSILDRIKVSSHVGYNVFGTASAFWQDRIRALNARLH